MNGQIGINRSQSVRAMGNFYGTWSQDGPSFSLVRSTLASFRPHQQLTIDMGNDKGNLFQPTTGFDGKLKIAFHFKIFFR